MADRVPVAAPPAAPPRVSLVAIAQTINDNNDWARGYKYRSEMCGSAGIFDPCPTEPDEENPPSRTIGDEAHLVGFTPYDIWAGVRCTTGPNPDDNAAMARRKLEAIQSHYIEAELWRGNFARTHDFGDEEANAYLASSAVTKVTDGAGDVVDVVACLDYNLAQGLSGQRAMIHVPADIATHLLARNAIYKDGSLLVTARDSIIVPGSGYDGSGPGASEGDDPVARTDGHVWIYGTSLVSIRLSPAEVTGTDDVDRTNLIEVRASRAAAASFDPCYFAAAEVESASCVGGS